MTMLNLEALLDESMDAVEEAPNYVTPENGVYILEVVDTGAEAVEAKPAKDGQEAKDGYVRLKHVYSIKEVISQEGEPIAVNSLFSDSWMATDTGLPHFKTRTLDIAEANGEDREALGKLKLGEMLAGVKGLVFKVVIKKVARAGAGNEGRYNTRLENIQKV